MLRAYTLGLFPMARSGDDPELSWFSYDPRGIIPLDGFHIPARLKRTVRQAPYTICVDTAFEQVIERCARRPGGETSWINAKIMDTFIALHRMGFAHSVEAWREAELVGGLYGCALGGAFFGESMFSTATDASKIALVHLVGRLIAGGFTLFDVQESNPHTRQFGIREISGNEYKQRLAAALKVEATFAIDELETTLVARLLARENTKRRLRIKLSTASGTIVTAPPIFLSTPIIDNPPDHRNIQPIGHDINQDEPSDQTIIGRLENQPAHRLKVEQHPGNLRAKQRQAVINAKS